MYRVVLPYFYINDNDSNTIVDVLFILFETSKMQNLCGKTKRTKRFEVTTSSSTASKSNNISIRYTYKYDMKVLKFKIFILYL